MGTGLLLFVAALLARLLFWQATADAGWPYSAYYRGDAMTWLSYADALRQGIPFQDGLPLRPPGAAYLVAAVWDGSPGGIGVLNFLWCVLGALVVSVYAIVLQRSFGGSVAAGAGLAAAGSTGLMMLSTSLNNETPYLILVMAGFLSLEGIRRRPEPGRLAAWCVLNGLACLVRVEHAVFFALVLITLASGWRRSPGGGWIRAAGGTALALLFFLAPLVPWQIHAWKSIRAFNATLRPSDEGLTVEAREAERWIEGMAWSPDAVAERDRLPGFTRRLAGDFVAATVRHRGGTAVTAPDFAILEEAFGYRPEPLAPLPFITSYGPLNFYLANNSAADAGFSRRGLDRPPPLTGGRQRYYKDLLLDPPAPGTFFFDWPVHLEAFNHGIGLGWRWIAGHPDAFVRRVMEKLAIFWDGASLGFTGYNIPGGLTGTQRAVDLLVPRGGPIVLLWRVLLLGAVAAGIAASWRDERARPWLLFLVSKAAVAALFFGYARIGATALPAVYLMAALALRTWAGRARPAGRPPGGIRPAAVAAGILLLVETVRFVSHPVVTIDSERVISRDPFPAQVHRDRRIEVR